MLSPIVVSRNLRCDRCTRKQHATRRVRAGVPFRRPTMVQIPIANAAEQHVEGDPAWPRRRDVEPGELRDMHPARYYERSSRRTATALLGSVQRTAPDSTAKAVLVSDPAGRITVHWKGSAL